MNKNSNPLKGKLLLEGNIKTKIIREHLSYENTMCSVLLLIVPLHHINDICIPMKYRVPSSISK